MTKLFSGLKRNLRFGEMNSTPPQLNNRLAAMSVKKENIDNTRRQFLNTVHKSGVALPVLQASSLAGGMMVGRHAAAQESGVSRAIFIYISAGAPGAAKWLPDADLTLKTCSASLEAVKDECVFFSGTNVMQGDTPSGGHGSTHRVLGGYNARTTIDYALENSSVAAISPVGVARMGVQSNGQVPISSAGSGGVDNHIDNPATMFDNFFGGEPPNSIDVDRKLNVLDRHTEALNAIRAKLGSAERERLDSHEAAIAKLGADVQSAQSIPAECVSPSWNSDSFSGDVSANQNFYTVFKLHVDALVLALKCNITNVGSFQLGGNQGDFILPGLDGITGTQHDTVHMNESKAWQFETVQNELHSLLAYLITRLKEETDLNGRPLLDSTVVCKVTDMGDPRGHTADNAPFLLAGGGASIQRGKVESCSEHTKILDVVSEVLGVSGEVDAYSDGPATGVIV